MRFLEDGPEDGPGIPIFVEGLGEKKSLTLGVDELGGWTFRLGVCGTAGRGAGFVFGFGFGLALAFGPGGGGVGAGDSSQFSSWDGVETAC